MWDRVEREANKVIDSEEEFEMKNKFQDFNVTLLIVNRTERRSWSAWN